MLVLIRSFPATLSSMAGLYSASGENDRSRWPSTRRTCIAPLRTFRNEVKTLMRYLAAVLLVAMGISMVGCGTGRSAPGNINGTWNASLIDINNVAVFTFGTSLVVNGDGS